ncbi:MAG TPA: TonB-dependent receptor, partial [Allosphingosinicella sp.]|nr:TonB-dependent receptor [Allosphingosinicella sp.]
IAKASGMKGQFNWRPEFRAENTKPLLTAGSASVSGASGPLSYTVGVRNDSFRGGSSGPTSIYNDAGDLTDFRDDLLLSSGEVPKISGSLKYDGPGGSIGNLNASYALFNFTFRELSERSGPALVDRIRRIRTTEREYNYEVGGDYEMGVGPGRLKLIGLRNFEHSPIVTTSVTSFADDAPQTGSRFARNADETETVGRAEYRWKSGPADWQVSAEGAFNVLDNVSGFFVLQPNGEFSEVPLPNGSATVKEDRAEASVTYGRPLSAKLAVQASLGAEYSQLSQTGEAGKTRTFYRPKGFVSAAWKATPRLDVNARLERKVGQLNFYDFLASENLSSGTSNAGNADLVPPQSWDAELSGVRNLGAWGTTTVRAYARLISDIVDQIPIGLTGEAPGNLDEAKLYGVEWKSTVNFTPIGWSGAKLDARFQLQNSKLNDPLTGEPRRISGNMMHLANLSLRHDVPGSDWAWGTSLSYQRNARIFRLNEIYRQYEGPAFGNLFLENKDVLGLTLRGTIGNLYGGDDIMHRVAHVGRRNATGIAFVERRKRTIGPIFAFSVSGTI